MIPIVTGTLGTVPKGLAKGLEELEIRGKIKIIQTTALLRLARILRKVLEICGDSDSIERSSVNTGGGYL